MTNLNIQFNVSKKSFLSITQILETSRKGRYVLARCICGKEKKYRAAKLTEKGGTISCGCIKSHLQALGIDIKGKDKSLYQVWGNMRRRCYSPNSLFYHLYGGIGVKVCDEWKNSFVPFYNWAMGMGWKHGLEVDKDIIPAKLGIPPLLYSPEMCTITTTKENCRQRKSSKFITFDGITKTRAAWIEDLNMPRHVFSNKIRDGWTIDEILQHYSKTSDPMPWRRSNPDTYIIRDSNVCIEYNGIKKVRAQWIKYLGITVAKWEYWTNEKKWTPQQIIEHFSNMD